MEYYQNLVISSLVSNIKKVYDRAGKDKKFPNYISKISDKENMENLLNHSKEIALLIDKYSSSKDKFSNQPLESVFNVFRTNLNNNKTSFSLDSDEFIPKTKSSINKNDYSNIVKELDLNIDKVLENKELNNLLSIMEDKLSKVPLKTSGEKIYDISIYDNAKLTAALIGCNYYSFIENNQSDKNYILLSADVSGIQSFIYTISSKGALKSLRGRSFYLEIIVENIIDEILEEIGLCRANLLYSGGGHFYMLLPNTTRVKDIIEKSKENINGWFLEKYSIDLYLEISYVEVGDEQLCNKDTKNNLVGQMYKDVGNKNSKGKLQRYNINQLEKIMFEGKNEQDEKECLICHKSFKVDEETGFCENCTNIMELGANLPKIYNGEKCIVIRDSKWRESLEIPSINSNKKLYLTCEDEKEVNSYKRIYHINKKNKIGKNVVNIYAGIYSKQSDLDENLITFEELASKSMGVKKLGVLRADVDNLGKAFINGFEKESSNKYEYISLSRNSNLSYALSKFFKYEINNISKGSFKNESFKIIESDYQGDRNVAIVYAGGDDLFIVGAWNEIIELAVDINNLFKKFTNNKMTLSAGVGIFNAKYPINQMANQVGDLESLAKSNGKDRICLFDKEGTYLHTWDEFEEGVCRDKIDKMYSWFDFYKDDNNKLPIGMSVLYRLLTLVRNIKSGKRINLARIAYVIGRMEPGKEKKDIYLDFKETFYKWVLSAKDLKELETALTLIVYLNRKGDED